MSVISAAVVFSTGSPKTRISSGPSASGYRPYLAHRGRRSGRRRADDADRAPGAPADGAACGARPERASSTSAAARPAGRPRRTIAGPARPSGSTLTTDRGVFAGDRVDPGTKTAPAHGAGPPSADGRPARPRLRLRPDRRSPWPAAPRRHGVGRRRQRAGPRRCAPRTLARPARQRAVAAPDDGAPRPSRFAAIWSNPPIRIGKAALHELLASWLDRLTPTAPPTSCSATSAPTRWPVARRRGLAGRAARPRARATGSWRWHGEAARRHRAEAAPPGGAGAPAAGSPCSTAWGRRPTSARSCGPRPPTGSRTSGWPAPPPT